MGGTWVMLRCQCGRNFGSRSNSNSKCPRCNKKTSLSTIKSFSSSSELRDAVSKANVPDEIISELSSRLASYEKSERSNEGLTSDDIQKILSLAKLPDDSVTLSSVNESMITLNLEKMSAERLMELLETSSMVLRNPNNSWSVLQ
ncbi:MAG: hypothetical protein CL984_02320 [Euryarchaeota archaeon]|nr:hypothetical protein [Euryarchaeota archaeon]|tara:strand:+ start:406 stop:840 length:435 start_codon:yes stop_codon:yes gene_type:complete